MKHSRKLLLWTTVIIGMIVVAHNVRQRIFRNKLATTIARARYATFTCDAFSACGYGGDFVTLIAVDASIVFLQLCGFSQVKWLEPQTPRKRVHEMPHTDLTKRKC